MFPVGLLLWLPVLWQQHTHCSWRLTWCRRASKRYVWLRAHRRTDDIRRSTSAPSTDRLLQLHVAAYLAALLIAAEIIFRNVICRPGGWRAGKLVIQALISREIRYVTRRTLSLAEFRRSTSPVDSVSVAVDSLPLSSHSRSCAAHHRWAL